MTPSSYHTASFVLLTVPVCAYCDACMPKCSLCTQSNWPLSQSGGITTHWLASCILYGQDYLTCSLDCTTLLQNRPSHRDAQKLFSGSFNRYRLNIVVMLDFDKVRFKGFIYIVFQQKYVLKSNFVCPYLSKTCFRQGSFYLLKHLVKTTLP